MIRRLAILSFLAACALAIIVAAMAPTALAQGSRHDDIVFGPDGHPIANATVRVCQAEAPGTPCTPLATIYTDATLTTTAPNPFQTDGIGNYHFYAPSGRYEVQISGPGIVGTVTNPDVILAPDTSSSGSGNDISAFSLNLGGNLSVAGNATISGTLTAPNFNPGNFSPSTLNVTGNASFKGPRPFIDVTAYGAQGNGSTDDTAAIQAAISAACALSTRPTVYFPYGAYLVTQTQNPSTAPIFTTCSELHIEGSSTGGGAQFLSAPETQILVSPGASPNAAPVFSFAVPQNSVTVENMAIGGYNQAVYVSSANVRFQNTCLTVGSPTGMADNTPLKIADTIWLWFEGGCLQTQSASIPDVILTTDNTSATVGLFYFENSVWSGGGVQYLGRTNSISNIVGNFWFRGITLENCAGDFFNLSANAGVNTTVSGVDLDGITMSDCSGNGALVNFSIPNALFSGVSVNHSLSPGGGAIKMSAGTLDQAVVKGCDFACSDAVWNVSGKPIGGSVIENHNGYDFIVNTNDNGDRLRSDSIFSDLDGPGVRFTQSGSSFANLAIDPAAGVLFGDGASYGYSAQAVENTTGDLDLGFAKTLPPTNVTAAATTGGTLAPGTYYYWVRSAISCSGYTNFWSAPSLPSGAVVVASPNDAVTVNWTAPAGGAASVPGYCVLRGTNSTWPAGNAYYENNAVPAGTTTLTDNGSNLICCGYSQPPVASMTPVDRFTPTSLGIGTTSPQYNLDVNGSAAVNSLNGVQKAERFSGGDAAAKINACLTAAAATTGVCDARGLTGTITATSHIAIPAGTALLWGSAQLTVNDSTTHDAVEFLGDGAALVGYQEAGLGTVPRPDASGYIACGLAGCTTVDNPNAATRNVDWIHIKDMYLQADGANSTVINLTSIGHADLENNRFVLGTGGSSYGIYGNTSTGDLDSTNTLIKHNEFDPQSQNDSCLYLAGVFNSIVMEQNSCYLPAENTGTIGFALAKDTNGNYPNNDEFYGNDCEAATTSFGQICFNIVNAQSTVIGPNNRCENVYNCFQFPSDGSAVGIHLLDPYISISSNTSVKPNEPASAMVAIDNNGHNWLPSMHFGMNDLSGPNLLGNAGFEGWQSSTALDYWGGVSGTNINQLGTGIYQRQASASAPTDSNTQGNFNVAIGDNATTGLGVNSACIQVDSTLNYTLAFRIAAASTAVNFRPGFRFYSDANCTEADRITSVATNARVLTPANYAGISTLAGTGANWQSTNASLTYNNGITCNCNVTGADWQVASANTWTPTRNFAITFHVPNSYGNSATIAHSMRVFILENTAANPNVIYVDDAALSQGSVSMDVPLPAYVPDSGNPTVYGNLTVNGGLNVGPTALPATLTTGSPAANDCASFAAGAVSNIQDSGAPCSSMLTRFALGSVVGGQAPSAANAVNTSVIYLPNIQFSKVAADVSTADASGSDYYSWAITDLNGNVKCSVAAVNLTAGGTSDQSCTQGTVTLTNGAYIFAFTGNATTAKIAYGGTAPLALSSATSSSTSASGAMTFPISVPAAGATFSGYGLPAILLH
ncbi:MAG TPA: glycosyl hydrolase family 28-related protein [Candidatus Dormibacteraeota bacterium]|nr:glycosyl hydrolase family 28-related protein [Candidatus Dormibacteraeota bacterium]